MKRLVLVCGGLLMLAACGVSDKDRAVSGGGIGAGLGAAIGLVTGGPLAGIVLGGAFGAAAGLVTDEETIDLGEPLWEKQAGGRAFSLTSDGHGPTALFAVDGGNLSTADTGVLP